MNGNVGQRRALKSYWKHILVVLLLALSGVSFWLSQFQLEDLNVSHNVPLRNADAHWIYDGQPEMVLAINRIVNSTTDDPARISLWLNTSYFSNITSASMFYFNGTHYGDEAVTKVQPSGYPDPTWWTNHIYIPMDVFENKTDIYYQPIHIWNELANTSVEYRMVLQTINGSDVSILWWGGNFTIRYSDSDNAEFQTTYGTYWSAVSVLSLILLLNSIMVAFLWKPASIEELEKQAQQVKAPISVDGYPKASDIVERADALQERISSLRTASEILLGLAVAFFYFLPNLDMYLTQSTLLLVLACLGSLMVSLSDPVVKRSGTIIDDSMLPPEKPDANYSLLLRLGIASRLGTIAIMRLLLQIGVTSVIIGLIADIAQLFTRPYVEVLISGQFSTIFTQVAGWLLMPVLGVFALLIVPVGFRVYGVQYFSRYYR